MDRVSLLLPQFRRDRPSDACEDLQKDGSQANRSVTGRYRAATLYQLRCLADQLDVDGDLDFVAHQKPAGLERHVPVKSEVLAVDLGPGRRSTAHVAPG